MTAKPSGLGTFPGRAEILEQFLVEMGVAEAPGTRPGLLGSQWLLDHANYRIRM